MQLSHGRSLSVFCCQRTWTICSSLFWLNELFFFHLFSLFDFLLLQILWVFFPEFHQVRDIAEASFSGIKLKLAAFRYISDGNFAWTLLDELLSSNITLHTISDIWATLQMLARSGVPNVWQIACTVHCLNLRSWYFICFRNSLSEKYKSYQSVGFINIPY